MKQKRTEKECRHSAIKGSGIHKGEWTIFCKACGRDIAARYWKRAASRGKWLKYCSLLLCVASVCGAAPIPKVQTTELTFGDVQIVSELTTNWAAAGQHRTLLWWNGEGEDPNKTTYQERGTVTSNTVAIVNVRGKTARIQLDTVCIGTVHRSYTLETRRVYGPETFFRDLWPDWKINTNSMVITNIGGTFWITNLVITNMGERVFPSR